MITRIEQEFYESVPHELERIAESLEKLVKSEEAKTKLVKSEEAKTEVSVPDYTPAQGAYRNCVLEKYRDVTK